jgi:hypothetical protein
VQRRIGATAAKENEMDEYEILCKGTVVIGHLSAASSSAVRS